MFSLTRLPVTQQKFLLFHIDDYYTQNVALWSEIHRKERAGQRRRIFQIISIMSTETCQTFIIINPQVVFKIYKLKIYQPQLSFSVGEGKAMAAQTLLRIQNAAGTRPYNDTMLSFSLI